jgi:mono/diheme cytochrome c family protein
MIRTAFLALVAVALPALGQTTKKPATTTTGSTKTASTKTATPPRQKTTLSGVYTLEDAAAGKEIYAGLCSSCHTTANLHNSPEFRKKWTGKTLSDLFNYMRSTMPKNDPGSLADEDYGIILSYMLQMNKMPPGKAYLSTDTLELRKIRFDTVRAPRKP